MSKLGALADLEAAPLQVNGRLPKGVPVPVAVTVVMAVDVDVASTASVGETIAVSLGPGGPGLVMRVEVGSTTVSLGPGGPGLVMRVDVGSTAGGFVAFGSAVGAGPIPGPLVSLGSGKGAPTGAPALSLAASLLALALLCSLAATCWLSTRSVPVVEGAPLFVPLLPLSTVAELGAIGPMLRRCSAKPIVPLATIVVTIANTTRMVSMRLPGGL